MDKASAFQQDPYRYWLRHPQGEMLYARGGDRIIPPLYANISLTNRCNLRCTICASQTMLDATGTTRSDMPIEVFRKIRDQILPLVLVVELNSDGEPLLYPYFDEVLQALIDHDCEVWLQSNGTMFTARNLEKLHRLSGRIALSIDSVGPLFEEMRCNGDWDKVDAGIRRLMQSTMPSRSVVVTATVTERSLPGLSDVVRWAEDVGIRHADFHLYIPIAGGCESPPPPQDLRRMIDSTVAWCVARNAQIRVSVSEKVVYQPSNFTPAPSRLAYNFHPLAADAPNANPAILCMAPFLSLDIGVGGDIAPCCAAQGSPISYVGEAEDLADLWFGANLGKIRGSMRRGIAAPFPYPVCDSCIARRLPAETRPMAQGGGLSCDVAIIPLTRIMTGPEIGMLTARIPPGLDPAQYQLFEGESVLTEWSVKDQSLFFRPQDVKGLSFQLRRNI